MELVEIKEERTIAFKNPASVIIQMHEECESSVSISTSAPYEQALGNSFIFASDLESWNNTIRNKPESALLKIACNEYLTALLNACQGQYRNAFKGLRLVLELCLQSIHLSADLVKREEWLKGEEHTIWAHLTDEINGPLSTRFCKAFFPELIEHIPNFREISKKLYSELSECIHGNIPNQIPLPSNFKFSEDSFLLWHKKTETLKLVVQFSFTMRYLRSILPQDKDKITHMITEQLGYIQAIREECSKD